MPNLMTRNERRVFFKLTCSFPSLIFAIVVRGWTAKRWIILLGEIQGTTGNSVVENDKMIEMVQ